MRCYLHIWYARIGKVSMNSKKSTDVHTICFIKQKVLQSERITSHTNRLRIYWHVIIISIT